MDPRIIEPIFCFLSPKGKVKNVNSILEPYATHKKSLYGYSNFSVFWGISPHSAKQKKLFYYIIRVMIHQPASSFYEAQTGEVILEAEELLKLRETITRVYVQRTGKPIWVVSEDMERVFLCQQQKPKLMALLILQRFNKNRSDFMQIYHC